MLTEEVDVVEGGEKWIVGKKDEGNEPRSYKLSHRLSPPFKSG